MPPTPSQIREQLLNAIDQDAKVTNMVGVLEAITCLENIQITKEALEETRLGKIVNDIRKNTEDSALSLRCKKLVRVWSKQFVRGTPASTKATGSSTQDASTNRQPTPPTQGTTSTPSSGGNRTPCLKPQTSTTPTSTVDKKKSENRKRRKLTPSPGTPTSTGSGSTSAKKPRPAANTPTSNATKDQTTPETKNGMPAGQAAGTSTLQSSKSAFSKVKPSGPKAPSRTSSPALKAKSQSSPSLSTLNSNTSKGLSKSPSLIKQANSPVINRGKKLSPAVASTAKVGRSSPSVKAKQSSSANSTDSNRLDVVDATLHRDKANVTFEKDRVISSQQLVKSPSVQKSLQDSNSSSATVKLRSPTSALEERCTTPTCSSLGVNYRPTQPEPSSPIKASEEPDGSKATFSIFDDDYDDEDILGDSKHNEPTLNTEKEPALTSHELVADTGKLLGPSPVETSHVETSDLETDTPGKGTPEASPSPDVALMDLEEEEEEPVIAKPVTAEDLARVHGEKWEGVNGCYNDQAEWFDWTQSLSVRVQEDDALHILPYICLD